MYLTQRYSDFFTVDHKGVPNTVLVREGTPAAKYYKNKSVAEQNSIDMTWSLLMQEEYKDLRSAICANPSELQRFRQLVVNSVMATDIMDKNLKQLRNARWDKAFAVKKEGFPEEDSHVSRNRRATIIIEHLIQASDVAHTMQHWQYVNTLRFLRPWIARRTHSPCFPGSIASGMNAFSWKWRRHTRKENRRSTPENFGTKANWAFSTSTCTFFDSIADHQKLHSMTQFSPTSACVLSLAKTASRLPRNLKTVACLVCQVASTWGMP